MRQGRRDVYRPQKKRNWVLIPATILLILLAVFLLLFTSLQKYLVYGQDELSIRLPWESTESQDGTGEKTDRPPGNAELVIEESEYSDVQTDAVEE